MSEGAEWSIRAVEANGLGLNLIDEKQKLPWKKITNSKELENSLVTLIYSSGTTGLPKGMSPVSLTSLERMRILKCTARCQTFPPQPRC